MIIMDNHSVSESENTTGRLNLTKSTITPESSLLLGDKSSLLARQAVQESSKERFWVLFLFGCCTMINACGWISISPISELVKYLYNTSDAMVDVMY